MKKYRMFFGWWKVTLIALVILAGAVIVVLDAVMISGAVPKLETANKAVAGVSLAAAALVAVAAGLLLFNSYYKLDSEEFCIMLGFFPDKVEYSDIHRIAVNAETKEVFVFCKKENAEEYSVRLNLNAAKSQELLGELTDKCPFAVVETFQPPEKKKKK